METVRCGLCGACSVSSSSAFECRYGGLDSWVKPPGSFVLHSAHPLFLLARVPIR